MSARRRGCVAAMIGSLAVAACGSDGALLGEPPFAAGGFRAVAAPRPESQQLRSSQLGGIFRDR